jgi:large subunit ribosomal protein L5
MIQRLKKAYQELQYQYAFIGIGNCVDKSYLHNIHQVPRLTKIVINRGLGAPTSKIVEIALSELSRITAQTGVVTYSRRAVAGFKIREKVPVGVKVTLRRERIYAFFDRLLNLRLPLFRDFQGVSTTSFDRDGNYNIGLEEQLIFPEIVYEQINELCGMDIRIIIESGANSNDRVRRHQTFLSLIGLPFNLSA